MYRVIEYTVFFLVLVLFQVFFFGNLNLGVFVHPLIYVAFIILLPMETTPVVTLLLGLATGVIMDVSTGLAGLNSVAILSVSFARPYLLPFVVGRDEVKDGGIPVPGRIGRSKFLRYAGVLVFLHCLVYFTFEALSWKYIHYSLLRVLLSGILTLALVWLAQMMLPESRHKIHRN